MNFILRLKHWQVFPILVAALVISNFEIEDNQTLTTALLLTGMTIYFSWMLFTGHGLYQMLPGRIELSYNLFILNSFVWLASYVTIMILSDGEGMTFTGLAALPIFYIFFALLHVMMFPAQTLKSIERGKKVGIGECFGTFFLILVLPIGIWFLQPRINKVVEDQNENLIAQ